MQSLRHLALFLFSFILLVTASPVHQNQKRSTQVSLISCTFSNNVLAGSIKVQNIAYQKTVTVSYAVGNTWSSSQVISASYSTGPDSSGYETWTFSGTATGATQFYISYTVSGSTYYDPGNSTNYTIGSSTTTTAAASSASTATTTTTSTATTTTTSAAGGTSVVTSTLPAILPTSYPSEAPATAPTGCDNWNGLDSCSTSGVYSIPASAENRRWQTPPKGEQWYFDSFQDYSDLVGYADIQYSAARTSAVVTVNAASKAGEALSYTFGGVTQSSNQYAVSSSLADTLAITVTSASGKRLVLEPLNFIWQNQDLSAAQGSFSGGQKGGIVELFGWPYNDIANECAFLGKAGYMGVKVWPPQEHVWGSNYYETDNMFRPWYLIYQPVSYKLVGRAGTREELRAMIKACRSVGVRVYADAVPNHMSGNGNDVQNHRNDAGSCSYWSGHNATANSPYYTHGYTYLINPYTGTRPALEYPAVPYGPLDFHCEASISSWTDGEVITKGWLVGLADLNTETDYVQDRIATYFVDLLSIGFSGFRVDSAKHIGPTSLAQIFGRMQKKLGGSLPGDFVTWLEILMGGEKELLACSGGEWSWYTNFNTQLSAAGISDSDINKIKIWSSDYPKEFPICGSWVIPSTRFAIQNDDHDQQSPGSSSRDMGDQGSVLIKDQDVAKHRSFEVKLFSRADGDWQIKLILSSYMWGANGANGYPDGLSDCALYTGTAQAASGCLGLGLDPAYVQGICAYTMVAGRYTRPHRDLSIVNAMRSWVGLAATTASALGIPGCS